MWKLADFLIIYKNVVFSREKIDWVDHFVKSKDKPDDKPYL